jgi:hypothetical protein
LSSLEPPVVAVPIRQWSTITEHALEFAMRLSSDVVAVHISASDEEAEHLRRRWADWVEAPVREAGACQPTLMIVPSPYRHLFTPLFDVIEQLKRDHPTRPIAVIIPELVGTHWYQYVLHNHRSTALKAALLFRGDSRVVVINVPWYIPDNAEC